MKKAIIALLVALFVSLGAVAQSAQKVSEILETNEISKGQASYFTCVYKDISDESVSDEEAFSVLKEKNLFKSTENANDKISLSKACFLIARTAEMKGGIFYSITHSARYAFREFKAVGIVPQNADPMQSVSGSEFIALLNGFEKKGKTK